MPQCQVRQFSHPNAIAICAPDAPFPIQASEDTGFGRLHCGFAMFHHAGQAGGLKVLHFVGGTGGRAGYNFGVTAGRMEVKKDSLQVSRKTALSKKDSLQVSRKNSSLEERFPTNLAAQC